MANVKAGMATGLISFIILIVIVFRLVGSTAGELEAAADNVSDFPGEDAGDNTTLPLQSLFGSSGVIMLSLMSGVLIFMVVLALKSKMGSTR